MDVVVVGAGIIGGAIAWRLAQAGLRVALLDAGAMGGEASWAGAGMLAPGGEVEKPGPWSALAQESLALYPAFAADLEAESGLAIDYRACGAIEVARGEEEWRQLGARAEAQRAAGIHSRPLDAGELRAAAPLAAGEFSRALFYPADAVVDPRRVMRALRAALSARGVRVEERRAAESIELETAVARVRTAGGVMEAGAAVLAAGAWSGAIPVRPRQPAPSIPVRGHLASWRLPSGSLGPILRGGDTYILQRGNGLTIAGSSSERVGFNRELDPAIVADIRARAAALVPALTSMPEAGAWLGFRPATEDLEPRIGRFEDTRLWLAYGHYRNGILLAPATARRVAAEITASWGMG